MKIRGLLAGVVAILLLSGVTGAWAEGAKSRQVTVTGRVVDNTCLLGMGLKGEGHRECAIGCEKAGARSSLLDEKANVLYTLMADKPFVDPDAKLRDHLEGIVTIKGNLYEAPGGQKVLAIVEVQAAK
jgi:hypothetical protein